MNTNRLNLKYEHCLRPTDTQFIVHKLSRNQHLNIVGTDPIHGTTRLLQDVKILETQLPDVTIVYVNLRTYKDNFLGFLKVVTNQFSNVDKTKITTLAELSALFDKQATQKQIWFLLDSLDVAFETINDDYGYDFLGILNVWKDTLNIRLICVTEEPLKSCEVITSKNIKTTSPLQLGPPYKLKKLADELIEKELHKHNLFERAYIVAILRHDESFRFMQFLIEKVDDFQFSNQELSIDTQVKICLEKYEEAYKISSEAKRIHFGQNVDKNWRRHGGNTIRGFFDWVANLFKKDQD